MAMNHDDGVQDARVQVVAMEPRLWSLKEEGNTTVCWQSSDGGKRAEMP